MSKWTAVLVAMAMIGCGGPPGDVAEKEPGGPALEGPVATVSLPVAWAQTQFAKVALKTVVPRTTFQVVTVYDGNTDEFFPVACTSNADCATYNGTCSAQSVCQTSSTSDVSTLFYVRNFTTAGSAPNIPVPCDGRQYTAEVYAAGDSADASRVIREVQQVRFTMPLPATGATTCSPSGLVNVPFTNPSFSAPTIYAGMSAPYDRYLLGIQGFGYPWASRWALSVSGGAVAQFSGPSAQLTAPATAGAVSFSGSFYLDNTLLVVGESATDWRLPVTGSATAIASGNLAFP